MMLAFLLDQNVELDF